MIIYIYIYIIYETTLIAYILYPVQNEHVSSSESITPLIVAVEQIE